MHSKVDFHCRVFFTYEVRKHVDFTSVKRPRGKYEVSEFHLHVYARPFIHCLYIIYARLVMGAYAFKNYPKGKSTLTNVMSGNSVGPIATSNLLKSALLLWEKYWPINNNNNVDW